MTETQIATAVNVEALREQDIPQVLSGYSGSGGHASDRYAVGAFICESRPDLVNAVNEAELALQEEDEADDEMAIDEERSYGPRRYLG